MPASETRRSDIGEDLVFQQRDWLVQRVGWGLMALIVAAGLAGLLGPGPLSEARVRGGNDFEVEYDRFVRHGRPSELRVTIVSTDDSHPGRVHVAISRQYLSALRSLRVTPSPVEVQSAGRALVYVFSKASATGPTEATFVVEPDRIGMHEAEIAVDNQSSVSIRQFAYP